MQITTSGLESTGQDFNGQIAVDSLTNFRNIENLLQLLIKNESLMSGTINMVPSENFQSSISRLPLITDAYNRYFFNEDKTEEGWNFRGAQNVFQLETDIAVPLLCELGKADYVNLRSLSGLNAMLVAVKTMAEKMGSKVLIVSPDQGGHYATKNLIETLGYEVDVITGSDPHSIDWSDLANKLSQDKKFHLIYIDQSNCLFPIDVDQLVKITRELSPTTKIHIDASHWLGLIFGGAMRNPLAAGADSFGGSTHKTFPGPQKAVFFTNHQSLAKKFREVQYYLLSSHHFGSVLSLAISLIEFKDFGGFEFAHSVIKNSKLFAQLFDELGYDVKGKEYGYTAGHQVWMSTETIGVSSFEASRRLYESGVRLNVFQELPGYNHPILRIGLNEITRFGANEEDIKELVNVMHNAINLTCPPNELQNMVRGIRDRCRYRYGFDVSNSKLRSLCDELYNLALCNT